MCEAGREGCASSECRGHGPWGKEWGNCGVQVSIPPPPVVRVFETGWTLRARETIGQMNPCWVKDLRGTGTPGERMKGWPPEGREQLLGECLLPPPASRSAGAPGAAGYPLPHGARHGEGLERHGAHLAVRLLQGPAANLLRGGGAAAPSPCPACGVCIRPPHLLWPAAPAAQHCVGGGPCLPSARHCVGGGPRLPSTPHCVGGGPCCPCLPTLCGCGSLPPRIVWVWVCIASGCQVGYSRGRWVFGRHCWQMTCRRPWKGWEAAGSCAPRVGGSLERSRWGLQVAFAPGHNPAVACSILFFLRKRRSTRVRTGRRRRRCSSRPSMCRPCSSPCRPCSACECSLGPGPCVSDLLIGMLWRLTSLYKQPPDDHPYGGPVGPFLRPDNAHAPGSLPGVRRSQCLSG